MKVILLADVRGSGKKNDIIDVSDGYARNFLLPKKLAKEATSETINAVKVAGRAEAHRKEVARAEAKKNAEKIDGSTVKVCGKGGGGKMFGSISAMDIAAAIKEQHGVEIDKKKIEVASIKSAGDYPAVLRLYPDVSAKITVQVEIREA